MTSPELSGGGTLMNERRKYAKGSLFTYEQPRQFHRPRGRRLRLDFDGRRNYERVSKALRLLRHRLDRAKNLRSHAAAFPRNRPGDGWFYEYEDLRLLTRDEREPERGREDNFGQRGRICQEFEEGERQRHLVDG